MRAGSFYVPARTSALVSAYFRTMVNDAFLIIPPWDAEIVTTVFRFTAWVVMLKLAVVLPASTVTVDGTVATPLLPVDKFTTNPPVGAAPVSDTVPTEVTPPRTLVGFNARPVSVALGCGLTVIVVDRVPPL